MREFDLGWAVGFLEGEGYFTQSSGYSIRIAAKQVDRWPLDRLQAILGCGQITGPYARGHTQPIHVYSIMRIGDIRRVAELLRPFLSARRLVQIDVMLAKFDARTLKGNAKRRVTHCAHGHEFTPENTQKWTDSKGREHRRCAACHREMEARRHRRLRVISVEEAI